MKWTCSLAIALLWCATDTAYAAYKVDIDAPRSVQSLLKEFLDLSRYQDRDDISPEQLRFMVDTAGDQVRDLTSTEGYFSPVTKVEMQPGADDDASSTGKAAIPRVRVTVDPGPRTLVTGTELSVTGNAAQQDAARVAQMRRDWSLGSGAPFRQEDWDRAKNAGLDQLQQRSYPAARIAASRAEVDPEASSAALSVQYDSGPAFTLGPLEITGTRRYPESIVRNVNPLVVGEPYDADRLLSLQRQIQKTPYFSNAIVAIDNDPAHPDMAPVKVQVTEFPTQRIRTGVGYSTDTRGQVEGLYSHYNVFNRAYVFDSQLRLEQERQYGTVSLSMPPDSKSFVNSVNAKYERLTLEGTDLRTQQIGIKRARSGEFYDTAYSLTFYRDQLSASGAIDATVDAGGVPLGKQQALVPGFAWARRNVDDPIFPRRGNLLNVEVGFAVKGVLSDQSFTRLYGRFKQFLPVGKRDVVVLRAEAGGVFTAGSADEVPASLLFRTGGNDSVRGFSYQSIGHDDGSVVYPAKYLAVASAEYQHWLTENWGAAVFYDAGTAADNWNTKTFYNGVGVGARWRSPVGTLNLDLAYGVQKKQIRPHVSLGIAF